MPTVASDLGPAWIGVVGVLVGGAIATGVPAYLSARARVRAFHRAALVMLARRSNVLKAVEGLGAAGFEAEAVLRLTDDEIVTLPPDDQRQVVTLRNEVYLVGGELNDLVQAYADCKRGHRSVPAVVDFLPVRGAFSDLIILHRIEPIRASEIERALTRWSD
jgi:hypothetical protein